MPDVICVLNNNKSDTCAYHTIQSSRFSYFLFHYSMFQALFNREGFFRWIFFCFLTLFLYFHHHSRSCCFREHAIVHQYTKSSFMPFGWCFSCHHHRIREMMLFLNSHYCLYYYSFAYISPLLPTTSFYCSLFRLSIFLLCLLNKRQKYDLRSIRTRTLCIDIMIHIVFFERE